MAWGLTRSGAPPQQAFSGQDLLYLGDGRHPPPHQTHNDRYDDGQRQESLAHADEPLRLPRIAPFQLARS
jgi:hypothetical protein